MLNHEWLTDRALSELEDIAFFRDKATEGNPRKAVEVRDIAAQRFLVNLVLEVKERRAQDLATSARLAAVERVVSAAREWRAKESQFREHSFFDTGVRQILRDEASKARLELERSLDAMTATTTGEP